jgi:hypothetical protein
LGENKCPAAKILLPYRYVLVFVFTITGWIGGKGLSVELNSTGTGYFIDLFR